MAIRQEKKGLRMRVKEKRGEAELTPAPGRRNSESNATLDRPEPGTIVDDKYTSPHGFFISIRSINESDFRVIRYYRYKHHKSSGSCLTFINRHLPPAQSHASCQYYSSTAPDQNGQPQEGPAKTRCFTRQKHRKCRC